MPSTVNGIGTIYYGKWNLTVRTGLCEHCHQEVPLQSYDTRLWFVIIYIPIIPLGRKRIVDYCPRCTRHRVLPLDEWNRLTHEVLDAGREEMAARPDDAEAAIKHFREASVLEGPEAANRLAAELKTRFARNAEVQLALGAWYERSGRDAEADGRFLAALELEGDNKAARRAVAVALIQKGRPGEAHALLDFMASPGPDQDPKVLVLLGEAYQKGGEHERALEVFAAALKGSPQLGRDRPFRKRVRASQAAAPGAKELLPRTPLWRRRWAVAAAVAALLVAGVAGVNYWIATHRTLHVANGLSVPVTVRLDGGEAVEVRPNGRATMAVSEGRHQAEVTIGADADTVSFEVAVGWLDRFFKDPLFVLNVGGGAVICREQAFYSTRPEDHPSQYTFHVGQPYTAFADVDYAFQNLPETIQMDADQVVLPKTRVWVLEVAPAAVIGIDGLSAPPEDLMRFMESHLRADAAQDGLLVAYCEFAGGAGKLARCRDFLSRRLGDRPVRIEWHRYYQGLCEMTGRGEQMVGEYRRLAAAEPGSSDILYLLGRVLPSGREAAKCFEKAIAADEKNLHAWLAKGFHNLSRGDFAAARDAYERAGRLDPEHPRVRQQLVEAWLATRDYEALEADLGRWLSGNPLDFDAYWMLVSLRVARDDGAGARKAQDAYVQAARALAPPQPDLERLARIALLIEEGNYTTAVAECGNLHSKPAADSMAFLAYLEADEIDAAAARLQQLGSAPGGHNILLLSIGYGLAGREDKARTWRDKAREQFASSIRHYQVAAELLGRVPDVDAAAARDLDLAPGDKPVLLVALAQCCPDAREELLPLAEKLNYRLDATARFLRRAIEKMK